MRNKHSNDKVKCVCKHDLPSGSPASSSAGRTWLNFHEQATAGIYVSQDGTNTDPDFQTSSSVRPAHRNSNSPAPFRSEGLASPQQFGDLPRLADLQPEQGIREWEALEGILGMGALRDPG